MQFRDLKEEEIEVRVARIGNKKTMLLLYKDARCDMNILDEAVGALNWKREHVRENKNCIVSIWDDKKKMWISKEDTGVQSYSEPEKGLASDSFKRACFNWGIGRELYTAPKIEVENNNNIEIVNGKTYDSFKVTKIVVENKKITELEIMNCRTLKIIYRFKKEDAKINVEELREKIKESELTLTSILNNYNVKNLSALNIEQYNDCLNKVVKYIEKKKRKKVV